MKAAVLTAPYEITVEKRGMPQIQGPQDVLFKILQTGICGSDMLAFRGGHKTVQYPRVLGHECVGEVVAVGYEAEKKFLPGDLVTVQPQLICGTCYPCRHGKYNLCEELKVMGFQTTGTASEFFAVDAKKVTPIPKSMSFEEGAMLEPLAVAVHAVRQMGDVTGMNIAVLGAGPIGNLVAQAAKGLGAAKVMITDVSDWDDCLREVQDCRDELLEAGCETGPLTMGCVVDMPSAALMAGDLMDHGAQLLAVDIEDLTRYTLGLVQDPTAAIRQLANPAVLRLVQHILEEAQARGMQVYLCGITVAAVSAMPAYLKLGVRTFSAEPAAIMPLKRLLMEQEV